MSINYPTSLDAFSNPIGTDLLENAVAALDHDVQHSDANDGVEALQAKVGVNSSAVTTSHDYKLSLVTSSQKALTSGTTTASVTNLTLVTPIISVNSDATGDMYYRNSGGTFTRLAIGSASNIIQVSSGGIPEWIANPSASDASVTVKGVVEEATQAEYDARTAAGSTLARLAVNPSTVRGILYHDYALDAAGSDTYAITVTPAPTAYTTGDVYTFKAGTVNTGAATLNVNSLGAKSIKKNNTETLADGDIAAGQIVQVAYDGTSMQMVSPVGAQPVGSAVSGSISHSSTTTENVDNVVTTTFLPKTITVHYFLQGNEESGTDTYSKGVATFDGTTIKSNLWTYKNDTGNTAFAKTDHVAEAVAPFAGTGGTNSKVEISIQSLSATGFTLRAAFTEGSTFTGAVAKCYAIATA